MFNMAPFKGWPSGRERMVMYLNLQPNDFVQRYGINNWTEQSDDILNVTYKIAWIKDEELGPVVFLHYENTKDTETEVFIDASLKVEKATRRLIKILELSESDIFLIFKTSMYLDLKK